MSVFKKTPIVVAVVGMTGAGKGEVTKFFKTKQLGVVYFGGTTLRISQEQGLPPGEESERKVRNELREKHGMAAFAIVNEPEIRKLLDQKQDVVIDGLYSWDELVYLREKFEHVTVVAVIAQKATRYKRLAIREIRPLTKEEAISRDINEIEQAAKGGPIAFADYFVSNEKTVANLEERLETLYHRLKHD